MNTILHILSTEKANTGYIYLYREGIFYKAYERSAYIFITMVQKFMVKKKFFKCTNCEVVSIGFPSNSIHKHFAAEKIKEIENGVVIEMDTEIDVEAFEEWKQNIELTTEPVRKTLVSSNNIDALHASFGLSEMEAIMKIRMFPLEGKTPLECMMFLSELKKEI